MRVLHVDASREWRGGQTQLLHLVRRMPGSAVALPPDASLRPALEDAGVPVVPVAFLGALRGARRLREAIRRFDPDVVAAHTSHAHGHAVVATRRPVVVHRRLDFRPSRLSRAKYRRVDRFVAVSAGVRDVLVDYGVCTERIDVVHDGVDRSPLIAARPEARAVRDELRIAGDAPLALAVGALVPHKGHRYLVAALPHLTDWHVAIAGEGPLHRALAQQARRLGVSDRLHLLGRRDDVPRLLKSVDLFVHPSTEEGMGQAVAEALICGCRVVASDTGGLTEIVEGRGLLAPPGDPQALAQAIRVGGCMIPPDLRAVRDLFGIDAMVAGTLQAYQRAAATG